MRGLGWLLGSLLVAGCDGMVASEADGSGDDRDAEGEAVVDRGLPSALDDRGVGGGSSTEEPCAVVGAVECRDAVTLRRCLNTGVWGELRCADGEACVGMSPQCRLVPCTAGERRCVAADLEQVCSDRSMWLGPVQCSPGEMCSLGRCGGCEAGMRRCAGRDVQACDPVEQSWGEVQACAEGSWCVEGRCRPVGCFSRVLLLVDRSASMFEHWDAVQTSLGEVLARAPMTEFGLAAFPRESGCAVGRWPDVPLAVGARDAILEWMASTRPNGDTPLLAALEWLGRNRAAVWGALPGHVIVVSDGNDSCTCRGDCPGALSAATANLYQQGISTVVIGYDFAGVPEQLEAIAAAGGTTFDRPVRAEDAAELTTAFEAILDDIKACPD